MPCRRKIMRRINLYNLDFMDKKTIVSLLLVVSVGVVGVASYYFAPGGGYQGFIGKKTYQNEEDVPPWCVKPKATFAEEAPVLNEGGGSRSTEPSSRGGSSNVGIGIGSSGDSYFVDPGFSSEDFIRPSFDISGELPDWGSMFENDGKTPGTAVGPGRRRT